MTRACAWGGCSRAFESNATRDAKKLGLMPFEIARKGHRITAPWQECGDMIVDQVRGSLLTLTIANLSWHAMEVSI